MSQGGVFRLIINQGKTDKLINAYSFLMDRISKYANKKNKDYSLEELSLLPSNDGYLSIDRYMLPSLNYIEQTHNTFVNGTYKPCIPVAYEYNKISHNNTKLGETIQFTLNHVGNFINDMVVRIKLKGLKAVDNRDRVRYVAFLGHRLLENVKFSINLNPLDEYTTDDYNAFYQHEVPGDKKLSWLRMIGQETPDLGYLTADPSNDMIREYRWFGNGNQTLKQSHDEVELYIPLLFWFREVKNALPIHIVPWGQTHITIKLADVSEIVGFADYGGGGNYISPSISVCELYTNNIYIPNEIFDLYQQKFTFNLIRVHRQHKQLIKTDCSQGYEVLLHNIKWPVETLFVSFRPRSNLNLSQYWHKHVKLTERTYKTPVVAKNESSVLSGSIVSAITASNATAILSAGGLSVVDDTYNSYDFEIIGGTGYDADNILNNRYIVLDYNGTTNEITLTTNWRGRTPDSTTTFELFNPQLAINLITYQEESPVVQSMALEGFGNTFYEDTPEKFYNSYLTYRFGKYMVSPEQLGHYMINFNLYPGSHHPSGSLNFSVSRETYLKFVSSNINSTNPADVIVVAKCLNFLLVDSKSGSCILKYST